MTDVNERDVYESAYVRKAAVDVDVKASRLQDLKDRLAVTEGQDAAALQEEIKALEQRIDELMIFSIGSQVRQDTWPTPANDQRAVLRPPLNVAR